MLWRLCILKQDIGGEISDQQRPLLTEGGLPVILLGPVFRILRFEIPPFHHSTIPPFHHSPFHPIIKWRHKATLTLIWD